MAEIRLYREFFCFSYIGSGETSNNLINPYYVSATTKVVSGHTIIEELIPLQESFGIYYVSLNPILYSFSNIYEVNWHVSYFNGTPSKMLPTRFRLNPINIGSQIDIDISQNTIEIELDSNGVDLYL